MATNDGGYKDGGAKTKAILAFLGTAILLTLLYFAYMALVPATEPAPAPRPQGSSTLNNPSPFVPPAAPAAGNTAAPAHPAAHGASHSAPAHHR